MDFIKGPVFAVLIDNAIFKAEFLRQKLKSSR